MSLLTPADLAALKADLIRWNVGALVVFTGICAAIALADIRGDLTLLKWMIGVQTALILLVLGRVWFT